MNQIKLFFQALKFKAKMLFFSVADSFVKGMMKIIFRLIAYQGMKQAGLGKKFESVKYEEVTRDIGVLEYMYRQPRVFVDREADKYYLVIDSILVGFGNLDKLEPSFTVPKDCQEYHGMYNYFMAYALRDEQTMKLLFQSDLIFEHMMNEFGEILQKVKEKKEQEKKEKENKAA